MYLPVTKRKSGMINSQYSQQSKELVLNSEHSPTAKLNQKFSCAALLPQASWDPSDSTAVSRTPSPSGTLAETAPRACLSEEHVYLWSDEGSADSLESRSTSFRYLIAPASSAASSRLSPSATSSDESLNHVRVCHFFQ